MKKIIAIITVLIILSVSVTSAKAFRITEKNTAFLKGQITQIEKTKKNVIVTVNITSKGKWKNNLYSIVLDKKEFKGWQVEEGKIKKGQKVNAWLYKNKTKNIYDDKFIHISKIRG